MSFDRNTLEAAHKHSVFNKAEGLGSDLCGCFYCLETFIAAGLVEFADEDNEKGMTLLCPHCGIDSVIGDKSGFPVGDQIFLSAMNRFYF